MDAKTGCFVAFHDAFRFRAGDVVLHVGGPVGELGVQLPLGDEEHGIGAQDVVDVRFQDPLAPSPAKGHVLRRVLEDGVRLNSAVRGACSPPCSGASTYARPQAKLPRGQKYSVKAKARLAVGTSSPSDIQRILEIQCMPLLGPAAVGTRITRMGTDSVPGSLKISSWIARAPTTGFHSTTMISAGTSVRSSMRLVVASMRFSRRSILPPAAWL